MLVKELKVFALILIVGALAMHHKEFLSHPIEHILALPHAGAYGLGFIHPVIFGFILYILAWIPRKIINAINKKSPE